MAKVEGSSAEMPATVHSIPGRRPTQSFASKLTTTWGIVTILFAAGGAGAVGHALYAAKANVADVVSDHDRIVHLEAEVGSVKSDVSEIKDDVVEMCSESGHCAKPRPDPTPAASP